jgi:L-amino acid N-acyltransferase YncA
MQPQLGAGLFDARVGFARRLPHLVAESDGIVIGNAYAAPFRKRPAYRYTGVTARPVSESKAGP